MIKNNIFILVGPSGSGKNSILKSLLNIKSLNLNRIVTCTARPKRANESEGIDHYFISQREFNKKIEKQELFEFEIVHGHYYGILKSSFDGNKNCILEIDIQGAISVRKSYPQAKIIFINCKKNSLAHRLKDRGQSESEIAIRMKTAENEWHLIDQADIVIENQDNQLKQAINLAVDFIKKFH